ncbi:MAG: hypothetical protein WKF52_10070 [Sphingomicrobium sp.]
MRHFAHSNVDPDVNSSISAELVTRGLIGTFRRSPRFTPMKEFALIAASLVAACSSDPELGPEASESVVSATAEAGTAVVPPDLAHDSKPINRAELLARVDAIDAAIAEWRGARTLAAAKSGAEKARNLVTGPAGPAYGDVDGDGTIGGEVDAGLLPGLGGEAGLASARPNPCMIADVLGGDFSQAAARWATMDRAIANWRADNNTFPSLASHPQRIVGWATLTLQRANLAQAKNYAGHAQLHADKTRAAITQCKG